MRGELVELTKQEFDILYLLASRRGIVFSRAALIAKVWGEDTYVTERTVDSVVSRLRRKIERDPNDPEMILTAWGVGYKFARRSDSFQRCATLLQHRGCEVTAMAVPSRLDLRGTAASTGGSASRLSRSSWCFSSCRA